MNNSVNLGQYNLKRLLVNPMLIPKIQDALADIKEGGILGEAIRNGAYKNIAGTIKMILSQHKDNPGMITEIVGEDTLQMIDEYTCGEVYGANKLEP